MLQAVQLEAHVDGEGTTGRLRISLQRPCLGDAPVFGKLDRPRAGTLQQGEKICGWGQGFEPTQFECQRVQVRPEAATTESLGLDERGATATKRIEHAGARRR